MFRLQKSLLLFVILSLLLQGCGFGKLSKTQSSVQKKLHVLLIAYRMRADLVPAIITIVESGQGNKSVTQQLPDLRASYARAISVDLPPENIDQVQILRIESIQTHTGGILRKFLLEMESDQELSTHPEFAHLKTQVQRSEQRIVEARRDFIIAAEQFNKLLGKSPERWYNKLYYKFTAVPTLGEVVNP